MGVFGAGLTIAAGEEVLEIRTRAVPGLRGCAVRLVHEMMDHWAALPRTRCKMRKLSTQLHTLMFSNNTL